MRTQVHDCRVLGKAENLKIGGSMIFWDIWAVDSLISVLHDQMV